MAKRTFSMQKLLDYNSHMEELEKQVLSDMRARHRELCGERDAICEELEARRREMAEKIAQGMVASEIVRRSLYLDDLREKIEQIEKAIANYEQGIDKQIDKLLGVSREKNSMEKLRDRNKMEFEAEERKKEELYISEFLANSDARKNES